MINTEQPNTVGLKLQLELRYQFSTFREWVNHASTVLPGYDKTKYKLLCFDSEANLCELGADFSAARLQNRFPVTAFLIPLSRSKK